MGILGVASMIAVVIGAGYHGTKWLLKKDDGIEDRRRGATRLAGKLRELGLVKTPEFLEDYAVGDFGGMGAKIKSLADLFVSGDVHVLAEFDKVFDRLLSKKLGTAEGRALIEAKLDEVGKQ